MAVVHNPYSFHAYDMVLVPRATRKCSRFPLRLRGICRGGWGGHERTAESDEENADCSRIIQNDVVLNVVYVI